ncbi:THUMP-like domain-containing protein [Corynebacterium halotolerans]|uniref:THUMP-like domain-containing protein n=1 Tax=Corynebacterium halotolerans YIM 70093 = DSM 44683 TaxID=1121362 RepID=M1MWY1_9CORY|nr:hypothetical protein [Corynebacterium halotolerans]AGF72259.1 hypothetical protein A605_06265 [Corynebacterium halotolerans YIM 70093 = DSM 44683]
MAFTLDEVAFLAAHAPEIADATARLELTRASTLSDAATLRERFGGHGRAVAELVRARRSAAAKFPATWLTDHDAAQQATPSVVARVRAARLREQLGAGALIHDVTCSIGTEGASVRAAGLGYLGSDLDAPRLAMARHNLGDAWLVRADALHPVSRGADAVVADPARRAGGRRITRPDQLLPPLPDLVEAWRGRELAVKCAPGLDFSEWEGLVSLVSVDGAVKEACLYTPGLSGGTRREAVMVSGGEVDRLTDAGGEAADAVTAGAPGRFILDPDGAVVRAGLVRHYAAREGLWMLDERIAYLTGDRLPAGRTGFPFIEQVPLKKLKPALAAHGAGSLEILVRGVDVDPDDLRKKLKLKGRRPMAVVCTRIGSQGVALICGPRTDGAENR